MMPPWMIEELEEEEQRRLQKQRNNLRLPVGDIARDDGESASSEEPPERGVTILDISPSSDAGFSI